MVCRCLYTLIFCTLRTHGARLKSPQELGGDGKLSKRASVSDFVDVGEGGWFQDFRMFSNIFEYVAKVFFVGPPAVALKAL